MEYHLEITAEHAHHRCILNVFTYLFLSLFYVSMFFKIYFLNAQRFIINKCILINSNQNTSKQYQWMYQFLSGFNHTMNITLQWWCYWFHVVFLISPWLRHDTWQTNIHSAAFSYLVFLFLSFLCVSLYDE